MNTLIRLGFSSEGKEIGYIDVSGKDANKLGTAPKTMNGSVYKQVNTRLNPLKSDSWSFFGMSLNDGYHSTLVGVHNATGNLWVFDQINGAEKISSSDFDKWVLRKTQAYFQKGRKNQTTIWEIKPNTTSINP